MSSRLSDLLISDRVVTAVVVVNAIVLFLQESGVGGEWLSVVDAVCTLLFLAEMIAKQVKMGVRGYWRQGWNIFDGIITLVSLPSLLLLVCPLPMLNPKFLQVFRVMRVFKMLRTGRLFPRLGTIVSAFRIALHQSMAILLGFVLLISTLALVNCCLFRSVAPQYFATPLDAFYSVFRLFTVEGWYDIPDAITVGLPTVWKHLVRLYFSLLILGGGVIGMSLINSIFVDAMVADNNDDMKAQLRRIEAKLDALQKAEKEEEDK